MNKDRFLNGVLITLLMSILIYRITGHINAVIVLPLIAALTGLSLWTKGDGRRAIR